MENTKKQQQTALENAQQELKAFHKLLDDAERKSDEQQRQIDALLRSRQRG